MFSAWFPPGVSVRAVRTRTYAPFSVRTGLEPVVAVALVRARHVDTITVPTNVVRTTGHTLVDVPALVGRARHLCVSLGTDAGKRTD